MFLWKKKVHQTHVLIIDWIYRICKNSFLPVQLSTDQKKKKKYTGDAQIICSAYGEKIVLQSSNNNTLLINIRLNLQNGLWKTQKHNYVQQNKATTIQSSVQNQSLNMAFKDYNASSAITHFFLRWSSFCCFSLLSINRKQNI